LSQPTQQPELPYFVKIETSTGHSSTVPIAFLTPKQVEDFIQLDFKRIVQEAGVQGARVHIERATTADYERVIEEFTACLQSSRSKAA
jgi:hypothetical protein